MGDRDPGPAPLGTSSEHYKQAYRGALRALGESQARHEAVIQALVNRVSADLGTDPERYLDQLEFNVREACAKIADEATHFLSCSPDGHGIAAAIRAGTEGPDRAPASPEGRDPEARVAAAPLESFALGGTAGDASDPVRPTVEGSA